MSFREIPSQLLHHIQNVKCVSYKKLALARYSGFGVIFKHNCYRHRHLYNSLYLTYKLNVFSFYVFNHHDLHFVQKM